jgi:hypothetical protein
MLGEGEGDPDPEALRRRKESKSNAEFQKVNALMEANERQAQAAKTGDTSKLTRKERRKLARVS